MRNLILRKSETDNYALEIWGTSTKHADYIYYFDRYIETEFDKGLQHLATIDNSFLQWICYIASHRLFDRECYKMIKAGAELYNISSIDYPWTADKISNELDKILNDDDEEHTISRLLSVGNLVYDCYHNDVWELHTN